jgi:LysR family transcriptional regulator, transcriptional activator of the cysJI operon
MARFSKAYPSVKLTLRSGNSREIEEWIVASSVDLALINNPTKSPLLEIEPYRSDELIAFVPANHSLASKKLITTSELVEIPLVIRTRRQSQSKTEEQLSGFEKTGRKFHIALRCDSHQSVMSAVRHGAGVGILYRQAIQREIDRGEFRIVKLPGIHLTRQSYIVYPKEKPLSPIARQFLDLLRAEVKGNGATTNITRSTSVRIAQLPRPSVSLVR